jgi:toxin ParE1/3/4
LESIYDYIAEFDCVASANRVLDQLMEIVESLSQFPERGSYPKELVALGIKEYRQASFKPYRVIHRVIGNQVIIYLIADGRRDMQSVLVRRLLGA